MSARIAVTDRYGGRSLAGLCHGPCEGMGFYPHKLARGERPRRSDKPDLMPRWVWRVCSSCGGTGRARA